MVVRLLAVETNRHWMPNFMEMSMDIQPQDCERLKIKHQAKGGTVGSSPSDHLLFCWYRYYAPLLRRMNTETGLAKGVEVRLMLSLVSQHHVDGAIGFLANLMYTEEL